MLKILNQTKESRNNPAAAIDTTGSNQRSQKAKTCLKKKHRNNTLQSNASNLQIPVSTINYWNDDDEDSEEEDNDNYAEGSNDTDEENYDNNFNDENMPRSN